MKRGFLAVGVTVLSMACSGSPVGGGGSGGGCVDNAECVGGAVCRDGVCRDLCSLDSDCGVVNDCTTGRICEAGLCEPGCRQNAPVITTIDGDGTAAAATGGPAGTSTLHRLQQRILVTGENLTGATARLVSAGPLGAVDLLVEASDLTTLTALVPDTVQAGEYTLEVINAAGSDQATVWLLQGEQGATGGTGATGAQGPQGMPASYFTNILINGAFQIWQRGIDQRPDMWNTSGAEGSFVQETVDVTGGSGAMHFVTTNPSVYAFYQVHDVLDYRGYTLTLAVDVKNDPGLQPYLVVDDGVSSAQINHTGSGNWERLTATFTVDPAATKLVFRLFTTNTNTAGGILVDNGMLVLGGFAAVPFVPTSPSFEWQRALRYYERGHLTASGLNDLAENTAANAWAPFRAAKPTSAVLTATAATFVVWLSPHTNTASTVFQPGPATILSGVHAAVDPNGNTLEDLACNGSVFTGGVRLTCEIGDAWQVTAAVSYAYSVYYAWVSEVPIEDI